MAHANQVFRSIDNLDASRCVDIFRRADGTFGFEEFRRDVEDARGWFPVGGYSDRIFADHSDALTAAASSVPWLAEVLAR